MKRKKTLSIISAITLSFSLFSPVALADTEDFKPPEYFVPDGQTKKNYYVDEKNLNSLDHLKGYETSQIFKGINQGAGYWIEVPENWNGKLILYAHGYRGTGAALTLSIPSFRKDLLERGYAWAASSYSTNSYDVESGVKDTHALHSLFNKFVRKPDKTYMIGHSMGGHITGVYAEQYGDIDGALPMCGVMGDSELFDFFTDYSLVAQSLVGITKEKQQFPADDRYFSETVPMLQEKLGNGTAISPFGAKVLGPLTDIGAQLKVVTENLSGGQRPMFDIAYNGLFSNFLLYRIPTNPAYEQATGNVINNTDSVYQLDFDSSLSETEKALNTSVRRITNDPQARHNNGLAAIPKVTGDLRVPTISLHTLGDLYVPFSMEQVYAQRVQERGKSDLLVSRAIRGIGHCEFSVTEQMTALDDLNNWVEKSEKPAGDDILNLETVAKDDFGITFTNPLRPYDPLRK